MKRFFSFLLSFCLCSSLSAQDDGICAGVETRTSFRSSSDSFSIDYCALYAKGEIGREFTYYLYGYPNRFNRTPSYFDALSWGMLTWAPFEHLRLEMGKQMLEYAGNEYYYKPIDVFSPGEYWRNFSAFQLALTGQYLTDGGDILSIQFGQSPFRAQSTGKPLYSFSASARGDHECFGYSASVNFFEYADSRFTGHQALAGWAEFGPLKIELDVINRTETSDPVLFKDYSVVGEAFLNLGAGFQLMAKYTKDRNANDSNSDSLVFAGADLNGLTGGVIWRPESAGGKVRFHALFSSVSGKQSAFGGSMKTDDPYLDFGLTWDIKLINR